MENGTPNNQGNTENAAPNYQVNTGSETPSFQGNVNPNVQYTSSTGAVDFVDPNERPIFSLKNGYALNLISGESWKKEDAVITNKRMYYYSKVGLINKLENEEIVDLNDITGTKISSFRPYFFLFTGILLLVGAFFAMIYEMVNLLISLSVPGIVLFALYFALKKEFLRIEYAGGHISFSVKQYNMILVRQFQRVIHAIRTKNM